MSSHQTVTINTNTHSHEPPSLIALLQKIQEVNGYLPQDALKQAAAEHGIPLSKLFAIATFYNAFSLIPQGKHIISICHGTACHVQKSENLNAHLARVLQLAEDEGTSSDLMFTLKKVRCLGCCSMAPVIKIDDTVFGTMTQAKAEKLIRSVEKGMPP